MQKYPTAEIVIMTHLHRVQEDDTTLEYGTATVREAILEVAQCYALPVVDLWQRAAFNRRWRFPA